MPEVWHITRRRHVATALSGEGARLHGGRWTTPGLPVVHASATLSLATLEILVHLSSSSVLPAYSVFRLEIPADLVETFDPTRLTPQWRQYPAPVANLRIGDAWLRARARPVLRLPSAVIPHEHNYLLNPEHDDLARCDIDGPRAFDVDPRVFGLTTNW